MSTMSPGTSSSASISMAWPSRRTRAMFFIIFSSAARLASALDSWLQAQDGVEDGQAQQNQRGAQLLGDDLVDDGGAHQEDLHEVPVLAQEGLPARLLLLGGQDVGAVLLQALLRLGRAQTTRGIDPQLLGNLRRRQGIPALLFYR